MSTIVTRSGKGSPLTHNEVDANFTNLNTDKVEKTSAAITGGTIDNTAIGGTTPAAGTFTTLTATGQTSLGGAAGSESFRAYVASTSGSRFATQVNSNVYFGVDGTATPLIANTNGGIFSVRTSAIGGTGNEQLRVSNTASAVNYVQVTGAATTAFPIISSQGSDSAVSLGLTAKGGNAIIFFTNSGSNRGLRVSHVASSVNYVDVSGSATGSVPVIGNTGSDSNIGLALKTTGTGAIDLAAGSSGVNISNGGTVTAITRTNNSGTYTSVPTVVISAPTTAGGVQATANAVNMIQSGGSPTINSGGTGYTVGDVLTIVGGTPVTTAATMTVTSVSGGVITGINYTNFNSYTVVPTAPFSVTGGTGSGATFTSGWYPLSFTITNAGSGYVEQPTVTFSGGGGSGAAAYASVGAATIIKTLFGTTTSGLDLSTPAGAQVRIADIGDGTRPLQLNGGSAGATQIAGLFMNTSGASLGYSTNTGTHAFYTGGRASNSQFQVAHTASAVNYVQVTGAATAANPTISSQGSDTNINLVLNAKGSSSVLLQTAGQNVFQATGSGTVTNRLLATGTATTFGPILSCVGGDTNIPLVLQPKGTGALQAQQTDSTATGGNARGANAVDWQTLRSTNTMVASGQASVLVGGQNNSSTSYTSFVGAGANNTASGPNSAIVAGNASFAPGQWSFIGSGNGNTAGGYYNFIGGGQANSGTSQSVVTTQSATMNGTTAVTLSGSNASIKVGQYITGTSISGNTYVAAISGTSLTLSQAASGSSTSTLSFYTPHGVVVGGGNNQATGSYSFIGGGGDAGTAANRNVASGDYATVVGGRGNQATGIASFIGGGGFYGTGGNSNVASGIGSVIGGGWGNQVTNTASSVLGGAYNIATGQYGSILSGQLGASRSLLGYSVFSAVNPFSSTQGGSQTGIIIIAKQTTDATPSVLTSDATAGSGINQVILPNNSAYTFRGEIVSGVTGGGNSKSWTIEGLIKRGANAASTTLVGSTVTSNFADAGASTWTIALTADTTNGGLAVTFTGQASTTIRTVCQIRTTEMTY